MFLLYEFAIRKNYNIEFITLEYPIDRINYILENKADITGGALDSLSNANVSGLIFSYGTLWAETTLIIPKEYRKSEGKIQALDENYNVKENKTIYFPVKVGDKDTVSACVFPESYKYNEYALINCTNSDLKGVDPTKNGFKLGNSPDTLSLNNVEYNPNNLLNANNLTGRDIIDESDKTDFICLSNSSAEPETTIPSTVANITNITVATTNTTAVATTITTAVATTSITTLTTIATITNNTEIKELYYKTSKKKLSIGAVIGIVIPCAVVLVAAAILAFLRRRKYIPAPSYDQRLDKSDYKLAIQYPIQQVQDHRMAVKKITNITQQILQPEQAQKPINNPAGIVVKLP